MAALVTGNTVVIKPSSETPTIAAKFAEVLHAAGFPPRSLALSTGSGAVIGDLLVEHPKTRFVSFTGSREVGLRINELAAKPRKGQIWIKRVVAEMGGKDAIIVDREADLDSAVAGVVQSAFGYQGQKCSACSRAIVDDPVYDEFVEKLEAKVTALTVGPPEDRASFMGPVISAGARKTILNYIEVGRGEGRLIAGGGVLPGDGYFVQPTVFAGVDSKARIFQEEIFGPVLTVPRPAISATRWNWPTIPNTASPARCIHATPRRFIARARNSSWATSTSIANAPARWWARTRLADSICRAPIRRRAAPIICCNSCKPSRSRKNCSLR